jgi:hypothetical protein
MRLKKLDTLLHSAKPEERQSLMMSNKAKQEFQSRKSRGQMRVTYNESVPRIPGIYNRDAEVEIEELH